MLFLQAKEAYQVKSNETEKTRKECTSTKELPNLERVSKTINTVTIMGVPEKSIPGESMKRPTFEKCCSLNVKAMILTTVLFYSRYIQLGSVINRALIGRSFPSKLEIFCRKLLSKTCKN